MVGFAVASAVGVAAQNFLMLTGARAVRGVFAALLAPSTLSLLTTTFSEPTERGKAFGIFSAVAGSGSAVGLLLGGVLTSYLSWRWCLYVNDIIAVAGIVGAIMLLPKSALDERVHIDDPGLIVAILGLVGLVFGFSEAATNGWGAISTIVPLVIAAVLLPAFVLMERRATHPILPLGVLLNRNRGGSYLTILLLAIGMFAVFLFLTYYMEEIKRYSAIRAGVAFLPLVVSLVTGSLVTNTRLLPRYGPRWLVAGGAVLDALAMVYFAQIALSTSYWGGIFPPAAIFGLGTGVIFGCCFNPATAGTTPQTAGVATRAER
jgi:MFS family permease